MLVPGERRAGKDQREATFGIRDISSYAVDHGIGAGDKWLLNQSNAWVIKHPHAMMLIRGDDVDGVHSKKPYCRGKSLKVCFLRDVVRGAR
jgi:hypothetical protein